MEISGAAIVHTTTGRHGEVRGLNLSRRSPQYEGRFGRMFRTLPGAPFDEAMLHALAVAMTADREAPLTPQQDRQQEIDGDDEENSGISAGYTYLGQFIDHDLTFDPVSSLARQNDPDGLVDFRTPRFDLDSIYGRGPDDQPYLYREDHRTMLLGTRLTPHHRDQNPRDLPRNTPDGNEPARALIGDPRNDENVIVSQLQAAMLRFHNYLAEHLRPEAPFEEVQRLVRWHYQWVVLNDFLPTILGQEMLDRLFTAQGEGRSRFYHPHKRDLTLYQPKEQAFIPVEFAVAAYRFGHSMVRPQYRLNAATTPRLPIFRAPNDPGDSLVGFSKVHQNFAVDWGLFFRMDDHAPTTGPERVQPAYKIDTSLVNPLGTLPAAIAVDPSSLAERNLLRGWRMQLPSGQAVARTLGEDPIPDERLRVGKATVADTTTNPRLTDIDARFAHNAPLWYYILAEAQLQFADHQPLDNHTPVHLGKVGGRIVAEVVIGLLLEDSHSYLRQDPTFRPLQELRNQDGGFTMADLLRAATHG